MRTDDSVHAYETADRILKFWARNKDNPDIIQYKDAIFDVAKLLEAESRRLQEEYERKIK